MGRGYSGNHPRFSHRQDERYDAKEAYNKDLTASARLHYLENDRHDHESPANSHCSPMHRHNAKSEGGKGCIQQMGGAWRVISNKTDKPWPAKYASKSKAEAALRGYHAG
jgi:hypothetical protein